MTQSQKSCGTTNSPKSRMSTQIDLFMGEMANNLQPCFKTAILIKGAVRTEVQQK